MLDHYHIGAYGQVHQQKWSCCNAANRDTRGCQRTTIAQSQYLRTMSFITMESRNPSKFHHRCFSLCTHDIRKPQEQARSPSPIYHDAREAPEDPWKLSESLETSTTTFFNSEPVGHDADNVSLLMRQESQTDNIK